MENQENTLLSYMLRLFDYGVETIFFCEAEEAEHAISQAKNAYPECKVMDVMAQSGQAAEEQEDSPDSEEGALEITRESDQEALGTIASIMMEAGCKTLSVEYRGSGDSTDCFGISESSESLDDDQEEQVLDAVDTLIESFHEGFENGDGGKGVIQFTLEETLNVSWEHADYYVAEDCHTKKGSFPLPKEN